MIFSFFIMEQLRKENILSNPFRADLHCHTTCSDGSLDSEDLIRLAKEKNLQGLSITDHDCVDAYEKAVPYARQQGLSLGTGVEFSCMEEGVSTHILGYDFDLKHEKILSLCFWHRERRKKRNLKILEKLSSFGIRIEPQELELKNGSHRPIGRPHIAIILLKKGIVRSLQEAFQRFLGEGKSCFDPGESITVEETLAVIHEAGGKGFLAHPHLFQKPRFVLKLLEKPFDGVECYYSKCLPNQEKKWLKLAEKRGLLISGGSDFHGEFKPDIPLGCSWVGKKEFDRIFEKNKCC